MKKGDDFLSDWLKSTRAPDPSKLSRRTVKADRWDNADYEKILKEMRDFDASRARLCEVMEDTGNGMTADTFFSLLLVEPEDVPTAEIRPDYLINTVVRDEAKKLTSLAELRSLGTVGDDVNSALGFQTLRPELEEIFDKTQAERDLAEQIMEEMQKMGGLQGDAKTTDQLIADMEAAAAAAAADEDDEKGEAAQQQIRNFQDQQELLNQQMADLQAQINADTEALKKGLDNKMPSIRQGLQKGLDEAVEQAKEMQALDQSWGMEPGHLHRLSAAERIDLAKRIKDKPKLKKLAKLIGPMVRMSETEKRRKVDHARSEIYTLEQGNDLSRLIPAELIKIRHPLLRRQFRRGFLEKTLQQYKMRGSEKVGLGGIICEIDDSGSMSGDPEIWAKAVAIALLNTARQQKREFWGIHFGSSYDPLVEFEFLTPEDYTPDKILDFCEYFMNGGTDFMKPLSRALDILRDQHARTGSIKGDIVFITDGCAGVSDEWLEEFKSEQKRLGFQVFGVLVGDGTRWDEPLRTICDNRVYPLTNVLTGDDVRDVFSGMHQP